MPTAVAFTDEFNRWWDTLAMRQQRAVSSRLSRLRYYGMVMSEKYSKIVADEDGVAMRELRVSVDRRQLRAFYAADPRSTAVAPMAVVLLGGDKTGDRGFYPRNLPIAYDIYAAHIRRLETEGLL